MPNTSDAFDIRTCAQNAAIGAAIGIVAGAALYVAIVSSGTLSFSGCNNPMALALFLSAAVGIAIVNHASVPLLVGCVAGGLVIGGAAGALSVPINNYLYYSHLQSTSLDITPYAPTNNYLPIDTAPIEQNLSGEERLFSFHDQIKTIIDGTANDQDKKTKLYNVINESFIKDTGVMEYLGESIGEADDNKKKEEIEKFCKKHPEKSPAILSYLLTSYLLVIEKTDSKNIDPEIPNNTGNFEHFDKKLFEEYQKEKTLKDIKKLLEAYQKEKTLKEKILTLLINGFENQPPINLATSKEKILTLLINGFENQPPINLATSIDLTKFPEIRRDPAIIVAIMGLLNPFLKNSEIIVAL